MSWGVFWSIENGTLHLTNVSRTGYESYTPQSATRPPWCQNGNAETINSVIFDDSPFNTEYMYQWFIYCENLTTITNWSYVDLTQVRVITQCFIYCKKLTTPVDLSTLTNSNIKDLSGLFALCESLTTPPVLPVENDKITNMTLCFQNCSSMTTAPEIPVGVTNMSGCFSGCSSMTTAPEIPVGVTNMGSCFSGCSSLESPPEIPSGVTNMSGCFSGCSSMTTAPEIPNSVTNIGNCFQYCSLITEAPELPNSISIIRLCFRGCSSLTVAPEIPSGVTDMESTFADCTSLTTAPEIPSGVTLLNSCFSGCSSLTAMPEIPSSVTVLAYCFKNCTALTETTVIPNGVYEMSGTFTGCTSLVTAPSIPSSVRNLYSTFRDCTSLTGNIYVYNEYISTTSSIPNPNIFANTTKNIYVINGAGTSEVENAWKQMIDTYSNVHYEADDNPAPSLSMSIVRVGAMNSKVQVENGEYAYVRATAVIYDTYLPVGWSVVLGTKTLTMNGATQSPVWTETPSGNTTTLECWRSMGDTSRRTFTMQITDSIKDENSTVKVTQTSPLITQILPKAYKLVDYFHDDVTDTEGVAFGKFADEANLFDVDMPARFRDSVVVDRLVGEIKAYAGATVPTGWHLCDGSELAKADYPLLYNAIGDIWGTPTDSDHFVLPNLMGRVPVGCDANDTDFDTVGNSGGTKDAIVPYHTHTQNAHSHATSPQLYRVENRFGSGSRNAAGTYSGYGTAVNTNSQQPTIQPAGTQGNEVGANLQPYAVVNYIICCSV